MIFSFIPATLAYDSNNPYEQMNVAAEQFFTRFKKESKKIRKNPEILKTLVRENLLPYIQVKYAGALILGNYYQKASSDEKIAYFNAFEDYLVHALAQALTLYTGQIYVVESPKSLSGKNLISIRVLLLNEDKQIAPIRLDFQWRKNSRTGEWKAYDMIAEGISMISTKQNEWATILRNGGITKLTEQLAKDAIKPIKPE